MSSERSLWCFIALASVTLLIVSGLWCFEPWQKALPATVAAVLIIFASIPLFKPSDGTMKLRLTAFTFFATSAGWLAHSTSGHGGFIDRLLALVGYAPPVIDPASTIGVPQYFVCGAAAITYLVTLYLTRDNTAMGKHPRSLTRLIDEPDFQLRVGSFCTSLERNLNDLDRDAQWSDQYFVPLDAEVEIRSDKPGVRRISKLIGAMRGHQNQRFFLVLGDPGAGKSVALRKLARDLLPEVKRSRRIPVYLNLRDWRTPADWTVDSPPAAHTVAEGIRSWILSDLQHRLDVYGFQFLAKHFDAMVEDGRFFFILDSFDEIALLLDVPEDHEIHRHLSEGLGLFFTGMHHSRGVIASRVFRKPTWELQAPMVMEIRALSNEQIAALAQKRFADIGLTEELLANRPDLSAAARNPFTATLLLEYLQDHRNPGTNRPDLPPTRGEIFQHYLAKRLNDCFKQSGQLALREDMMLSALEAIAKAMFGGQTSFEISASELPETLANVPSPNLLHALKQAHLLRLSPGVDPRVSFTHRRFAEYLSARSLIEHPDALPLGDIPTDSLWRDTMVLYCEIADDARASAVASYCHTELSAGFERLASGDSGNWLRTLHTLRFLAEAFRGRTHAIAHFASELHSWIITFIDSTNPLLAKWALEASVLFRGDNYASLVSRALGRNDPWLSETALRAGSRLSKLDRQLFQQFTAFLDSEPTLELWRRKNEFLFALKLNSVFRPLRTYYWMLISDSWIWLVGLLSIPFVTTLSPSGAVVLAVGWALWVSWAAVPFDQLRIRRLKRMLMFYRLMLSFYAPALVVFHLLPTKASGATSKASAFLLPLGLAMFPWLYVPLKWARAAFIKDVWTKIKNIFSDKATRRRLLKVVGTPALSILGFFGLLWLFNAALAAHGWRRILLSILPAVAGLALGSVMLVIIALSLFEILRGLGRALSEAPQLLRYRVLEEGISRSQISTRLANLRSPITRYFFVRRLYSVKKVEGEWPEKPPYEERSAASSLLARFDERWRGLDR